MTTNKLEYLRREPSETVWRDGARVYLKFGGIAIMLFLTALTIGVPSDRAALPSVWKRLLSSLSGFFFFAAFLSSIAGNIVGAIATVQWTDGDRWTALKNTAKADLESSTYALPVVGLVALSGLPDYGVWGFLGLFLLGTIFLLLPLIIASFVLSMAVAFLTTSFG